MIVWSGRGFLSVLVLMVTLFASISVLPKQYGDYAFVIAAFVTAIFSWYYGDKWNNKKGRRVIDEETGQRILIKNNHSLFWINLEYWGLIFSILGIVILFQNSVLGAVITTLLFIAFLAHLYFSSQKGKGPLLHVVEESDVVENRIVSNREVILLNSHKRNNEKEDHNRFMPK